MAKLSFKDSAFGWDGLTTFIFSNIVLLMTLGLGFFWLLFKLLNTAIKTKIKGFVIQPQTVLIAGLCLENNRPSEEFKIRLKRVLELQQELNKSSRPINLPAVVLQTFSPANKTVGKFMFDKSPRPMNFSPLSLCKHFFLQSDSGDKFMFDKSLQRVKLQVIILGGLTGGNQISEAQAGADYLIAQGMNKTQIILEEQSRHTLENLQQARLLLLTEYAVIGKNIALISSRYHLYRLLTLAKGLKMNLQPVAAEENFKFSFLMWLKVMKEAYFLHWYWSGKLWVFITASKKSKARIS